MDVPELNITNPCLPDTMSNGMTSHHRAEGNRRL